MEAIKKKAIIQDGKVTIDVDGPDGAEVEVVVRRRKYTPEAMREVAARLREETRGTAAGHATIRRWIDEGRP